MTRVSRYKITYVVGLFVLAVLCLAILYFGNWSKWLALALILVLFAPGRLQGFLFRDLFRGRRALDRHSPAEALTYLERFLATIKIQPWRKRALWLSWSVYTPSVEAMALNNIGSAHLALGASDHAVGAWRRALELDPLYPIPHANLAVLAAAGGDSALAKSLLVSAKSLGYSGGALDRALHQVQSLLASVEARGLSA